MTQATMTNINHEPNMGWFTRERRNWLAAILASGLGGFAVGNGHTTQNAITSISESYGQKKVQLIQEKKQAAEEHCTAQRFKTVAKQAIVSANSDTVPTPDASALKPCPLPKK